MNEITQEILDLRKVIKKNKGRLHRVDVSPYDNLDHLFNHKIFQKWKNRDFKGIERWDVSNLSSMDFMFCGCKKFNRSLNDWNSKKVMYMYCTFNGCEKLNQPFDKWYLDDNAEIGYVFEGCKSLKQDDLSGIFTHHRK